MSAEDFTDEDVCPDFGTPNRTWVRFGERPGILGMGKVFYLPHQCDEWCIGDADEMKKFIEVCIEAYESVTNTSFTREDQV